MAIFECRVGLEHPLLVLLRPLFAEQLRIGIMWNCTVIIPDGLVLLILLDLLMRVTSVLSVI